MSEERVSYATGIPRLQPRGGSQEELNGCYAMLCEALRAWHRMQKDHPRETAAKVLKDVYGYEFHLNGGGCPWRLPSVDHEWATNGMRALGLPADRFEDNAIGTHTPGGWRGRIGPASKTRPAKGERSRVWAQTIRSGTNTRTP